ncbi:MAG: hypothetical protein KIS92_12090 [Planctomycetota bacterium]|nr:hypothetical protein [Planctomycetota bacterium]
MNAPEHLPAAPAANASAAPRRYLHAALSPAYLGLAVTLVALLAGHSPKGAGLAGLVALGMAVPPVAVVLLGWKTGSAKLVRAALLAIVAEVALIGWAFSPGRTQDFGVVKLNSEKARERLAYGSKEAYAEVLRRARAVAAFGSRETGSEGLRKTLAFVAEELARRGWDKRADGEAEGLGEPPPEKTLRVTNFPVLAPRDAGSRVRVLGETPAEIPAFALLPNAVQACATPPDGLRGRLAYLGRGENADWEGRDLKGAIAVFEFDSNDAWRKAYEAGAAGAVFLESPGGGESVRQADQKYLALVPLNMPRVYVRDETAGGGAQALRAAAKRGAEAELVSGMRLETVDAPVLEARIQGTQSDRELLVMAHADAHAVAPGLSFGGQEAFGVGAWLALFDYFAAHPPAFSLRFVLTTGHWQAQAAGRADAYAVRKAVGPRIAMAIGVALDPEAEGLILTDETVADSVRGSQYWFLKKLLFTVDRNEPAWIDQLEALSERPVIDRGGAPSKYAFWGGRPTIPGSNWSLWLAPVDQWPPLSHSIGFPTANQMMSQNGGMSVALVTCGGYRQRHFTAQDTLESWLPNAENLKPQLELSFALVGAIADLDPKRFPVYEADPHREYGGYNLAEVQLMRWNPGILWYDKGAPKGTRAFALLVPTDARFQRGRNYAFWPRPLAPSRYTHRQLQCLQTVYMAEAGADGRAAFPNVYCPIPQVTYNALAFALDGEGRITHAFDQGFHGDMEFRFLDRRFNAERMLFQVPMFECGALVAAGLVDHHRVNIGSQVEHEYRMQWGLGNDQDDGEAPWLRVHAVNEASTHTTADAYAWVQYRETAMIFLKAGQRCEVRAGDFTRTQALFNDDPRLRAELAEKAGKEGVTLGAAAAELDRAASGMATLKVTSGLPDPEYVGFRVERGEERRLTGTARFAAEQLGAITRKRLADYGELNVRSPSADLFQARADALARRAEAERVEGREAAARATETLAWSDQSRAYASTYRLLVDVVTTTIFYFLLLLPFGYLAERLLFPQPTLVRTCLVAAGLFLLFSLLLYFFHPGFHLAGNVFVTVVTFVIVILTLPALLIIGGRGLALLMEPGAKFKKRHSADAETWGVLSAALSLAVSNMRRRRLRTGLTLATITLLVLSLVLLTSTAASTQFYRERQAFPEVPYQGVQVMNTHDHTHGMNEAGVAVLQATYEHEARIVQRRCFNPGFEASIACYALPKKLPANEAPRRFTVRGAITLEPEEARVTGLDRAVSAGRFFTAGDENACLLSEDTAARQSLAVGDTVRFLGVDLTLVGLLRANRVDAEIVDVCGKPVTPQAFYRQALNVDSPDALMAGETLFVPGALVRRGFPAPFPVFSVVIVPNAAGEEAVARRANELAALRAKAEGERLGALPDRLRRLAKGELTPGEAERLAGHPNAQSDRQLAEYNLKRRTLKRIGEEVAAQHNNVDVYLTEPAPPWAEGARDRVDLLSAFARVSLQSGSFLILPFLIAFFMLLAIMIGNVYERRQEIHVFSSVGLAPKHVAGMFLAEALVYAGISSVLGYFLGIILLDLFRRAGWLPADFHPNYFGKVVIWSAALATGSSLLSVLYPMRIAALMVNPSLERIWRIESEPQGDAWTIALPFVAHDRREALGMLAFAREFLGHHRGERTGAFATEDDPALHERDGEAALACSVWLSPFERHLVQTIALVPRHEAGKERYRFDLCIRRHSGPDYLWRKSNHAFVDGLRKQMLIWRSLDEAQIEDYVRAGEAAAAGAKGGAA